MIPYKWRSIGAVAIFACVGSAQACEVPTGWSSMAGETTGVKVALNLPAETAKISERFDLELIVCSDVSEEIERVVVDAIMPAHRHGMNYRPAITALTDGRYRASGLLFHMPGHWQFVVDTYSANSAHRHTLDVMVK